ncbi:MAG: hypothetical protein LBG98_01905 [Puniceicoccales bacterium]|jgi:hypothetical protein|nr:hypothetical protein [Puniceicoccales bacterium]
MDKLSSVNASSAWQQVWNQICNSVKQLLGWEIKQSSISSAMGNTPAVGSSTTLKISTDDPAAQRTARLGKIDSIISNLEEAKTSAPNSVYAKNADRWIAELNDIKNTLSQENISPEQVQDTTQRLGQIINVIISPDINGASDAVGELLKKATLHMSKDNQMLSPEHKAEFSREIGNILSGFEGYNPDRNPLHQGLSALKNLVNQGKMTYGDFCNAMLDLQQIVTANVTASAGTIPGIQ